MGDEKLNWGGGDPPLTRGRAKANPRQNDLAANLILWAFSACVITLMIAGTIAFVMWLF